VEESLAVAPVLVAEALARAAGVAGERAAAVHFPWVYQAVAREEVATAGLVLPLAGLKERAERLILVGRAAEALAAVEVQAAAEAQAVVEAPAAVEAAEAGGSAQGAEALEGEEDLGLEEPVLEAVQVVVEDSALEEAVRAVAPEVAADLARRAVPGLEDLLGEGMNERPENG
jgi:hypothetical protein